MKEMNLHRLMESCCVDISEEYYSELHEYILNKNYDLNEINIDNMVVNEIQYFEGSDDKGKEFHILKETDVGYWVI